MKTELASKKIHFSEILAIAAIVFSFTGSGIAIFSFANISITPMRFVGTLCIFYMLAYISSKRKIEKYNLFLLALAVYIITVSVTFSPDRGKSIALIMDYLVCIAAFQVIITTCQNRDVFRKYFRTFLICLIATILICIFEYTSGMHIANNYTYGSSGEVYKYLMKAPTAFLYNPNNVGVLMIMSIPIVGLINEISNQIKAQIISIVIVILEVIVVLMTGSRGALVSTGIIVLTYIFISKLNIRMKVALISVGSFVLLYSQRFVLNQLQYGGMLKNGVLMIFYEGDGGRQILLKQAIEKVFLSNFLFGVGAGGVEIVMGSSVHNMFVEIITNFGVVGGVLLLFGFIGLFKQTWKTKDKKRRNSIILVFEAFFLSAFIPPTMMTLHIVWIILALVTAFIIVSQREELNERIVVD